jgi:uncharacterized protein
VPTTLTDRQTILDFITGLAFLGTGGGAGRIEDALEMLEPVLKTGQGITLVSPDELPDDAWTCAIASWGGRDPDEPPSAAELAQYGLVKEKYTLAERMIEAAKELALFGGVKLGAVVSMELGASATMGTLLTGIALGIPTVDSDYVGRAIPEAGQSKMDLAGFLPMPMGMVDRWGNITIVKSAVSALMGDRIARQVSVAAYGKGVGGASYLTQIKDAKKGFVRGSLLKCVEVGRALREGVGTPEPLGPLRALTGGKVLFTGEALATDWDDSEAYIFRKFTYRIRGIGEHAGEACRVWVKNEHHVVWRDDTVVGTSPDILMLTDLETNRPLSTRGDVTPGRKVAVFGMKALDPVWHTPAGLALLGPRHFGFDFDYLPLGGTSRDQ